MTIETEQTASIARAWIFSAFAVFIGGCGGGSGGVGGSATMALAKAVPAPTVAVKTNQNISGFPNAIDMYVPSNAEVAVIFLHGGGGRKENFAYELGIKNDAGTVTSMTSSTGDAWLISKKVMAIFPQGQTQPGYNAWTWSNYVMDSGQDDVAFLQSLVTAIRADHTLPAISKIYLVGHSNGGMMANRIWCEAPSTFDGYGALAGPPSIHLEPDLAASSTNHPCNPISVKPYISVVGDSDQVLRSTGNMGNKYWIINPALHTNSVSWIDARSSVLNDQLFHARRVAMRCAGVPGAPTVNGQITTYSDCNDTLRSVVIAQTVVNGTPTGGDHCLRTLSGPCVTTLAGDTGMDYKSLLVDFLKMF
jgi:poly(3-hydroxybutyrate) depolymerase